MTQVSCVKVRATVTWPDMSEPAHVVLRRVASQREEPEWDVEAHNMYIQAIVIHLSSIPNSETGRARISDQFD